MLDGGCDEGNAISFVLRYVGDGPPVGSRATMSD